MNASNAKDYLPLVQALAEGKTIEEKYGDGWWGALRDPQFTRKPDQYRVKPESKLAPWQCPEDVPFPALFRWSGPPTGVLMPILARWGLGFSVADNNSIFTISYERACVDGGLVSTDGGKTWCPCGKVVTQ